MTICSVLSWSRLKWTFQLCYFRDSFWSYLWVLGLMTSNRSSKFQRQADYITGNDCPIVPAPSDCLATVTMYPPAESCCWHRDKSSKRQKSRWIIWEFFTSIAEWNFTCGALTGESSQPISFHFAAEKLILTALVTESSSARPPFKRDPFELFHDITLNFKCPRIVSVRSAVHCCWNLNGTDCTRLDSFPCFLEY